MYHIYHIPGKKIGVTRNLELRVTQAQGYNTGEYEVIESSDDIHYVSKREIALQKSYGYRVDRQLYKDLINKKSNQMKINVTEQTTTFPFPKDKLKGHLMETIGMKWETSLGEFELTLESIRWIEHNAVISMYDTQRSFVYNKAFSEAFSNNFNEEAPNIYDDIRLWAAAKGIYTKGDSKTQYIKLLEEVGELAKAILEKDKPEIIDAIGDCVVVLTNLAKLEDLKIEDCVQSAYNVIKSRKGSMINGTFVKES